jgi:hypothetical protein
MSTLSNIPFELFVAIFDYFDLDTILSFRQLNSEWKLFIDGEDVSRYIIEARRFMFRGVPLQNQPEVVRRLQDEKYQTTMKYLSCRLRNLFSEGPGLAWSIPHRDDYKFCYGGKYLVLEKRKGHEVEVRDAHSQNLRYEIRLDDHLGPITSGKSGREILGMRIRADVLLISVMETESDTERFSDGLSHFLFYRLSATECSLLLSRKRCSFNALNAFYLCDFNARLVVMGTRHYFSSPKYYMFEVWSLATGQLKASEIQIVDRDVRAVCVTSDTEWSILCSLRVSKTRLGGLASNLYWIKTFSAEGTLMKDILFVLESFPSDYHSVCSPERWLDNRSQVTFGTQPGSDNWLISWKELKGEGKLRQFMVTRSTGHPISRRLISFCNPSVFGGVYVNIEAGYCFGLEQPSDSDGTEGPLYTSLQNLKSRGFTVLEDRYDKFSKIKVKVFGRRPVAISEDETVFENRVICEGCNSIGSPSMACSRERPTLVVESLHWVDGPHGDGEGILRRAGGRLELHRFDTCQIAVPSKNN